LIHQLADLQSILLSGDSLADVDVVDAIAVPDTDVALATQVTVQNLADLFRSAAFDTLDADLPTGFVLNDFAVAKGQAFIVNQILNGANIDATIGSVLHNF
jgi:hypothetical protein